MTTYTMAALSQERIVRTPIPGPRSIALHRRRRGTVSAGAGTFAAVYIEQGCGAILRDVDDNQIIDLGCGIGVTTIGHAHPAVAEAVANQAELLTHTLFTVTPYECYIELCEALARLTPGDFEKRSVLVTTGAEAVENAVKIARRATGRRAIVTLDHAFHGRTNLTMAMTYRPYPERLGMGPFPGELYSAPSSYPYRDDLTGDQAAERTIDYIRTHVGAEDVAALVFEPIQGDGGVIIPADGYLKRLQEFCRHAGIVFVADEVQVGIGRTGEWYASTHFGLEPDLVITAKGLAGGLPLSAVTGRASIMDSVQSGGVGGSFGGNPVSVAAALTVIDVIERMRLLDEARRIESQLKRRMAGWSRFNSVAEVRGLGAMFGVELIDPVTGKPGSSQLTEVIQRSVARGVLPLDAGSWDSVLRIMPSLVIADGLLEDALDVLESVLEEVSKLTGEV